MTATSRTSHPGEGLTPGITVRPARPGELPAAGTVARLAYEADGHHGDYLDVVADAEDRSRDAQIVVAVDGTGEVLGCVTFVLPGSRWAELSGPGDAEFRMLGVHPRARGRGIGRALTSWCIDRARACGARRLLLCSLPSMVAAHRVYTGLGFRRRPDLDLTPYPGLLLLGFELRLTADLSSSDARTRPEAEALTDDNTIPGDDTLTDDDTRADDDADPEAEALAG